MLKAAAVDFPVSQDMAGALVRFQPGALRQASSSLFLRRFRPLLTLGMWLLVMLCLDCLCGVQSQTLCSVCCGTASHDSA